jgi:AcrR family transcriptional regulator
MPESALASRQKPYAAAALALFQREGIRNVTVQQITELLNVSSKTLYQLFEDKAGLVRACFDLYRRELRGEFEGIEAEAENVAELLIRFYQQLILRLGGLSPFFLHDISAYFPEIWESEAVFGFYHTRSLLERGRQEGIFSSLIDPELCAHALTLLLRSMAEERPFTGYEPKVLLNNLIWPYVRGLCTPAGIEAFRRYRRYAGS